MATVKEIEKERGRQQCKEQFFLVWLNKWHKHTTLSLEQELK